jgi:hypothetical protein
MDNPIKAGLTYDAAQRQNVPEFNTTNAISELALSNNLSSEEVDALRQLTPEQLQQALPPDVLKAGDDALAQRRTYQIDSNMSQVSASEGGTGVFGVGDVVTKGIGSFNQFSNQVGSAFDAGVNVVGNTIFGNDVTKGIAAGVINSAGETVEAFGGSDYTPTKVGSGVGDFTEGIARFATGWAGLGKFKLGTSALGGVATGLVKGAVTDFVLTDRAEGNLFDFASSLNSGIDKFIPEYLKSRPGQGEAEAGFKAALAGAGIGAVAEGTIFLASRALRSARLLKEMGHGDLADELVASTDLSNTGTVSGIARDPETGVVLATSSSSIPNSEVLNAVEAELSKPKPDNAKIAEILKASRDRLNKDYISRELVDKTKVPTFSDSENRYFNQLEKKRQQLQKKVDRIPTELSKVESKASSANSHVANTSETYKDVKKLLNTDKSDETVAKVSARLADDWSAGTISDTDVLDMVTEASQGIHTPESLEAALIRNAKAINVVEQQDVPALVGSMMNSTKTAAKLADETLAYGVVVKLYQSKILKQLDLFKSFGENVYKDLEKSIMDSIQVEGAWHDLGTPQGKGLQTRQIVTGKARKLDKLKDAPFSNSVINALTDPKTKKLDPKRVLAYAEAKANDVATATLVKRFQNGLDYVQAYNVNSMLSGISTQMANMTSWISTYKRPLDLISGGLAIGNKAAVSEGINRLRYLTGTAPMIGKGATAQAISVLNAHYGSDDIFKAVGRAFHGEGDDLFTSLSNQVDSKVNHDNPVFKALSIPTKALNAIDELFQRANYNAHVYARALENAEAFGLPGSPEHTTHLTEALNRAFDTTHVPELIEAKATANALKISKETGWNFDRVKEEQVKILSEDFKTLGKPTSKSSRDYAQAATLVSKLDVNDTSKTMWYRGAVALSAGARNMPVLGRVWKMFQPFETVPINMLQATIENDPLLMMLGTSTINKLIAKDPEQVGRLISGTTLYTLVGAGVAAGVITGGGSLNPAVDKSLKESGWQPYSFVITGADGKKTYIPFKKYGQIAQVMTNAANISEALIGADWEKYQTKFNENIPTKILAGGIQSIMDLPFNQGITDLLGVMTDLSFGKPDPFKRLNNNLAGRVVPSVFRNFTQNSDDSQRDPNSPWERILVDAGQGSTFRIPHKYDSFGSPFAYPDLLLRTTSHEKLTAIENEMFHLAESGVPLTGLTESVNGLDLHEFKNKDGLSAIDLQNKYLREVKIEGLTYPQALSMTIEAAKYKEAKYPDRLPTGEDDLLAKGGRYKLLKAVQTNYFSKVRILLEGDETLKHEKTGVTLHAFKVQNGILDSTADEYSNILDAFTQQSNSNGTPLTDGILDNN